MNVGVAAYTNSPAPWMSNGPMFTGKPIMPAGVPGYFDLVYSRWFPMMDLNPIGVTETGGAVVVFRESGSEGVHTGYAVVIDRSGNIDSTSPFINGDPVCHTVYLGSIGWGDDVWVAPPGIVNRAKDGTFKLRLWDGTLAAETRNISTSGELLMDYGWQGYYYIFDPGSKKLFKARYWWEK